MKRTKALAGKPPVSPRVVAMAGRPSVARRVVAMAGRLPALRLLDSVPSCGRTPVTSLHCGAALGHATQTQSSRANEFAHATLPHSAFRIRHSGFTIVELLVVMAIIAILFSAVFVASTSVLNRARSQSTEAVMQVVSDAVEEFAREQKANPTVTKAARTFGGVKYGYRDRYGDYPPDELEVFTKVGLPGWGPPPGNPPHGYSLAPGGSLIVSSKPVTDWMAMRYYTDDKTDENALEFRDNAAMVLAITLLGDTSKAILDKIPARNWKSAPLGTDGKTPAIWLDRPSRPGDDPNGAWGPEDLEIRYVVDNWGTPLGYLSERDWSHTEDSQAVTSGLASSNHMFWRQVSSAFIRMNGGKPIIMSYGPDGEEQYTEEAMTTFSSGEGQGEAAASIVGDYSSYPDSTPDHKINHPLNEDNIYLNPKFREELHRGLESQ